MDVCWIQLPNALFALIRVRLASVVGFKSGMLISIVIFEIGLLVSAVAGSMNMLVDGKFVAGIGGSCLQSLCFVIGSQLVEKRGRGIVVACMSSAFGIASIGGPFLGRTFTTHVTWRWCFYINLPIGDLAFVVFLMCYNPNEKTNLATIVKRTGKHWQLALKLKNKTTWRYLMHVWFFF